MPKNTPAGFIIAIFSGLLGFALVWQMLILGIIGLIGLVTTFVLRTFSSDIDYYIDSETVRETEMAHLKELAACTVK
jgi:cytochrome o ubiquinol oxidase subunit 1